MLVVFGVSCGLAGIFSRRDAGTLATSLIRERDHDGRDRAHRVAIDL